MGQSLNKIFETTEALQYHTATIEWLDTDKSMSVAGIGTGTFAADDTVMITGADETANNGIKTIDTVAANKITLVEDVVTDAADANVKMNQIVVGSWMPVDMYSRIVGALSCSHNASLIAEWSVDGSTALVTVTLAIVGGTPASYSVEVVAPYVRYKLLNVDNDHTSVAVHLYAKEST